MERKLSESDTSKKVEIRAFGQLKKIFKQKEWSFPTYYQLDKECTALELAKELDLPLNKIEAVFINGRVYSLQKGLIKPGDRVAFVPPGTPGPYRVMLGMIEK